MLWENKQRIIIAFSKRNNLMHCLMQVNINTGCIVSVICSDLSKSVKKVISRIIFGLHDNKDTTNQQRGEVIFEKNVHTCLACASVYGNMSFF